MVLAMVLVVEVHIAANQKTKMLHSLVDFSLQISGYAIVVFALVGAGLAQSLQGHAEEQGSKATPPPGASIERTHPRDSR